jgi:putative ABC transport system permease protein
MNIWLRDFAYRIQVGLDIVLEAVLFVIGFTVITVAYHAIKAAFINPSETLRYE